MLLAWCTYFAGSYQRLVVVFFGHFLPVEAVRAVGAHCFRVGPYCFRAGTYYLE